MGNIKKNKWWKTGNSKGKKVAGVTMHDRV